MVNNTESIVDQVTKQAAAIAGPWLDRCARREAFVEWAKERRAINKEIDAKLAELGL